MGFFNFLSTAGKNILGSEDDAGAIKNEIESSFETLPIQGLVVDVKEDLVILAGVSADHASKEKAILIAGNIEGIAQVDAEQLVTLEQIDTETTRDTSLFYTIEKGDTLWAIASNFYKDGNKYTSIVEANLEVIKNADLIYPGQVIRIPDAIV